METKNVFAEKAIVANELGEIYGMLEEKLKNYTCKWDKIRKTENQARKYNWKTQEYELLWEDEANGIPEYEYEYGYVPKNEDEFTEENRTRIATIERVMKLLEKAL